MIKPPGKEIKSEAQLVAAMLDEKKVIVMYLDGAIADYGGPIEKIKDREIRINGAYYMRDACRFFLR